MADVGALATIASVIAAVGCALLVLRVQRELQGEIRRISWAEWLLICAILAALLLVLLPLAACGNRPGHFADLPGAGCSAAIVLIAGYVFSFLAHYRLLFGGQRTGPHANPEPAERWLVILTLLLAAIVFAVVWFRYPAGPEL